MSVASYRFEACLGAGAFGEVYLATQHTEGGLERQVAVKVLHEPLDEDSDAVKRMRDEGQLLALLAHPAVLGVHEFALVEGHLALVTEYVDGADLAWFCVPERLLPTRVALLVTLAIAEALDFAWRTPHPTTHKPIHLIHRDLKPENVRISRTGQVKILDFGVARSAEMERRAMTAAGLVILTPGFGAPETLVFGVVGPAVDVFALGVTLYAMLTGQTFYADDIAAQVRLASDSVAFAEHTEHRLQLIADPDQHALLRDLLEFSHEHRPNMQEVAERCDRMARRFEGPSLLHWVQTAEFPEVAQREGRLDGAEVSTTGTVRFPDGHQAKDPLPLSQVSTVILDEHQDTTASVSPMPTQPAPRPPDAGIPPFWVGIGCGLALLFSILATTIAVGLWYWS